MSEPKSISIIGCGWLGLPLAEFLLQKGYTVKGSTTRAEKLELLREKGIQAYQIIAGTTLEGKDLDSFFQSDILMINIPPGRRRPDVSTFHPKQIESIINAIKQFHPSLPKILFISSTGVFGPINKMVTEEDTPAPVTNSGKALVTVENMLRDFASSQLTIVRFSGLVGGSRKAGRFLSGKKMVANGQAPVNMVHRDDCIQIICQIIEQEKWGELYHVSADKHPTKQEFYRHQAEKDGFKAPTFQEENTPPKFKIIDNGKVKRELGYEFLYGDPMVF